LAMQKFRDNYKWFSNTAWSHLSCIKDTIVDKIAQYKNFWSWLPKLYIIHDMAPCSDTLVRWEQYWNNKYVARNKPRVITKRSWVAAWKNDCNDAFEIKIPSYPISRPSWAAVEYHKKDSLTAYKLAVCPRSLGRSSWKTSKKFQPFKRSKLLLLDYNHGQDLKQDPMWFNWMKATATYMISIFHLVSVHNLHGWLILLEQKKTFTENT
jgi:hypothetical protein